MRAARVPGIIFDMARCTAPVRGHRSASAAADCPVCGGRYEMCIRDRVIVNKRIVNHFGTAHGTARLHKNVVIA